LLISERDSVMRLRTATLDSKLFLNIICSTK
jgi:hypothetical protein